MKTKSLGKFGILTLKTTLVCLGLLFLFYFFYLYNNRLFLIEARIIWPQKNFEGEAFRIGNTKERASMAVDLIESRALLGVPTAMVRQILGDPTGDYYYQDTNYTYRLTNKGNGDWVLTFVGNDEGNVSRVFIRKSCCSVSHKILNACLDTAGPLIEKIW